MQHASARLPWRIYHYRILGMGLGGVGIAAVLLENNAPLPLWLLWLFTAVLWPHLAFLLATRNSNPYHAEVRNLLADSALVGIWIPLLQFNLLPSVLLLTLVTVDKINTGIPRLWLWSLPGLLGGLLITGLLTGFATQPVTSMSVIVASLPMLMIHTIAVSLGSNRLVHRIRDKNRQLDELSRVDGLTGLLARRHWQDLTSQALHRHHETGTPAVLLMLDLDSFKLCNDRHGHAFGDEVLKCVAHTLRTHLAGIGEAGRYGGDEFTLLLPGRNEQEAARIAEAIRAEIESIPLPAASDTRVNISVSVGLAGASRDCLTLEQWIERADAALYRAKHSGRNRVAMHSDTQAISGDGQHRKG
ncbi:diguanylate cyclase [Luteimonas sp. MJ293]|uniref:sensor domain-containing diguanylate cyclase n=1 Tax=Luteimonas sp. MJ146 TaxID=3129240 RepID=UPI0031BA15C1